ncbi:MAG: BBP7 family outer membrane beta-barrel protein [Pirellulales bacterium]
MKSLGTAALAVLLSTVCANATAQSAPNRAPHVLVPLPPVTRTTSPLVRTAYTTGNYTYDYDAPGPTLADPSAQPAPPAMPPSLPAPQHAAPQPPSAEPFESMFSTRTGAAGQDQPTPAKDAAAKDAPAANDAPPAAGYSDYQQGLNATGWGDCNCGGADGSCGSDCGSDCGYGCACGRSGFFAGTGGVVMTRNRGPNFAMTYDGGSGAELMSSADADPGWVGGGEVTLGYSFGGSCVTGPWGATGPCSGLGVAVTWWGLGEMSGFAQVFDSTGVQATALNASLNLPGTTINGNPFSDYFQGASSQRYTRSDNVNSVELNFLEGSLFNSERMQITGLAGFRYLRFSEVVTFGSVQFGSTWGDNGGADEAYMRFRCFNNLYGGQLGAVFNYLVGPKFSFYVTPKAGIYGNQMTVRNQLFAGDGGLGFNFNSYKSDVAFLGQLDTGFTYLFHPNVRAYLGYRVLGVSNLALGDYQFAPSVGEIKQSGSLILHGANVGLVWTY